MKMSVKSVKVTLQAYTPNFTVCTRFYGTKNFFLDFLLAPDLEGP